jgi:hypothetical protein
MSRRAAGGIARRPDGTPRGPAGNAMSLPSSATVGNLSKARIKFRHKDAPGPGAPTRPPAYRPR